MFTIYIVYEKLIKKAYILLGKKVFRQKMETQEYINSICVVSINNIANMLPVIIQRLPRVNWGPQLEYPEGWWQFSILLSIAMDPEAMNSKHPTRLNKLSWNNTKIARFVQIEEANCNNDKLIKVPSFLLAVLNITQWEKKGY